MRIVKLIAWPLCLFPFPGCIASYSHYDLRVVVRDAETQAPIANCEIVGHQNFFVFAPINAPRPIKTQADARGEATVHATTLMPQTWKFTANGYIGAQAFINEPLPSPTEVRLYREPEPQVTIVLPAGYLGPVAIELDPSPPWVQGTANCRTFEFNAQSNGYVRIQAAPLLMRMDDLNFRARYEDGKEIEWYGDGLDDGGPRFRFASLYTIDEGFADQVLIFRGPHRLHNYRRILYCVGSEEAAKKLDRSCVHTVPGSEDTYELDPAFNRSFADPPGTRPATQR